MGYYIPSTPVTFLLRTLLDIDWEKHFTPRTLMVAKGAAIFLDYQLAAGYLRFSGIRLPLANPRAAVATTASWANLGTIAAASVIISEQQQLKQVGRIEKFESVPWWQKFMWVGTSGGHVLPS